MQPEPFLSAVKRGKREDVQILLQLAHSEKWEGINNDDNSDNGKYDGEFKNGKPNGIGKLHIYFYGFFIGEFKNGKYWKGIQTNEEGDILVKYRNGKRK